MNSECIEDSLVPYTNLFKINKTIWKPKYYLYRLIYQGDRFIQPTSHDPPVSRGIPDTPKDSQSEQRSKNSSEGSYDDGSSCA